MASPLHRPLNIVPRRGIGRRAIAGQSAVYGGGLLLTEPRITPLYLTFNQGNDWTNTIFNPVSQVIDPLNEVYGRIALPGGWFNMLSDTYSVPAYPIGLAHLAPGPSPFCQIPQAWLFTHGQQSHPGAWSNEEIASMITFLIDEFEIPRPDDHSLYCVWLPPGQLAWVDDTYTIKTCQGACGFHGFNYANRPFAYTVATVPDDSTCGVCLGFVDQGTMTGSAWYAANLDVIATHEVAEAVTNPYAGTAHGWTIGDGEVCDVCVDAGPVSDGVCWYAKFWDNASSTCV